MIRRFLAHVVALITIACLASQITDAKGPQGLFHGGGISGSGGGGGGGTLFTDKIVNDSAVTSAVNVPTTTFGLNFQDNAITGLTPGTWPTLQIGGNNQPYTPFGVSYWPTSGRIKHMGVVLKPTVSTASAASQSIAVNSGGSQPAVSGRSLVTDLYSQNFQIEAISAGSFGNLVGSNFWVARLKTNDTHTYVVKTETWGDGQAGLMAAVWLNFFPADASFNPTSTTPHGQLMVKVYVFIMNDGSNNLGGFQVLARLTQPKYNNDTPAKAARAMSTLRYNFNGTLVNFTLDTAAKSFTGNGSTTVTSPSNFYYSGSAGNNTFAVMVTAAGTTGLSTSTLYYGYGSGGAAQFSLSSTNSNGAGGQSVASGTGTLQQVYVCGTFNSIYGLDQNWNWIYVQGSGSISTASVSMNWRHQPARDYLIGTNLIPSFDKTYTGVDFGGTVTETAWAGGPYNFDVNSIGPLLDTQNSGGERPDLGPVTSWGAAYVYNQDKNDLRALHGVAYAIKGSVYSMLDSTVYPVSGNTLTPPNIAEANGGQSFTGYPSSVATTLLTLTNSAVGYTPPSFPLDDTYGFDRTDAEHQPEHEYLLWTVESRPEEWDMLNDQATRTLTEWITDATGRNPTVPNTFYGVPAWPSGQEMRTYGHTARAINYAALASPGKAGVTLAPDGSDSAKYWSTLADNGVLYEKQIMDSTLTGSLANLSAYAATNGYWASSQLAGAGSPQIGTYNYQAAYALIPAGVYVAATGNSNGKAWLQHEADWLEHARTAMGPWAMMPYYAHNAAGQIGTSGHWPQIQSDTDYAQYGMHNGFATWQNSTSPYFSQGMMTSYSLHDGDVVFFNQQCDAPNNLLGGAGTNQHYFLRDTAALGGNVYNFNLATTLGGTAIIPTPGAACANPPFYHPFTFPSASTTGVCGNITMNSSCINHYGLIRQLAHAGVTVTAGVLNDSNSMVSADGLKTTVGIGIAGASDARYLLAQ